MEDLIIVGAGGMGRVVLQIIKDINQSRARWNVLGYIDDNPHSLDGMGFAEQVMGTIEDWQVEDTQNFVIAVGNPNVRNVCIQKLLDKGANFVNIIHPTAIIWDHTQIGKGCVIFPFVRVEPNAVVGDFALLLSTVAHDVVVGDYAVISPNCTLVGGCRIEKNAYIGSNVVLVNNIVVEENAYVGAGSVVIKNVKAGTKVFGNPARISAF